MGQLFSTFLWLVAALAMLLSLSGCAGEGGGNTNISSGITGGTLQTKSTGKGRYDAWAEVEGGKGETIKQIEATKQKKIDLEIARASQVKVVLDTPEKIAAWSNAQAARDLGDVAKALARGDDSHKYAGYFTPTPLPKSAFSEGLDSAGNLVVRVFESPVGVAGTVGYFVGSAARGSRGGTAVTATEGSTVTVNQATATGQSKATAGGGGAAEKDTATTVSAAHWQECITTTGGARPPVDEINGCMIGYGYDTSVVDGQLYYEGQPYTGPAAL